MKEMKLLVFEMNDPELDGSLVSRFVFPRPLTIKTGDTLQIRAQTDESGSYRILKVTKRKGSKNA